MVQRQLSNGSNVQEDTTKNLAELVGKGLGCMGIWCIGLPVLVFVFYSVYSQFSSEPSDQRRNYSHTHNEFSAPGNLIYVRAGFDPSSLMEKLHVEVYNSEDNKIRVVQTTTNTSRPAAVEPEMVVDTLFLRPGAFTNLQDDDWYFGHDGDLKIEIYVPRGQSLVFENNLNQIQH